MVAWSIWERRNRLRVGQSSWKIDEVVQRASELLHKFQDVQTPVRRAVGRSEDLRWKPPDVGLYKISMAQYLVIKVVQVSGWSLEIGRVRSSLP